MSPAVAPRGKEALSDRSVACAWKDEVLKSGRTLSQPTTSNFGSLLTFKSPSLAGGGQ